MVIQERYTYLLMSANSTINVTSNNIGGFLCTATGTLSLTKRDGTAILTNFAVTAGVYYPIPIFIGNEGGTAVTASSGAGLLLV